MGNETSGQVSSGASNDQPQNTPGAPANNPPASSATQPVPGATEPVSNPEAKKYADEAAQERQARKKLETELKKYQDAQAATELAKLGDLEKAQKQLADVAKQAETYRTRIADYEVQLQAGKLGIRDPEVAATLIRSQLDIGDDGKPTNAEELLKDLLKSKPYLKADEPVQQQQRPSPGATNPGRGAISGQVTKADVMSGRVDRQRMIQLWTSGEMEKILAQ